MLSSGISAFHFAEPQWLPALLLIPMLWGMYSLFRANTRQGNRLRDFADAHLLPHLLENHRSGVTAFSASRSLILWSVIWGFSVLAMAGPRWNYTDTKVYRPTSELVILLDLSRSMDVADVKPSRLVRARQEVGDILHYAEGVDIGLIAFAKIPHMIAPLTDDRQTLMRLLPSIRTELVHTQGSRLVQALDMAGRMLSLDQPKLERHILILSDGGYEDPEAQIYRALRALTDRGVHVHVMGIGTVQGGPVPNGQGGFYRTRAGGAVMASADFMRLKAIARDGQGLYADATYQQDDTRAVLAGIGVGQIDQEQGETVIRQWEERFYIFLLPGLLFVLSWFRRGAVFPIVFLAFIMISSPVRADTMGDYFLTEEQKGRKALEEKNYEQAEEAFKDDDYRRGVVQYKAGEYEQAAESFQNVKREEVSEDARYNLGNARLMEGKIEDAIKAYEDVLKGNPGHQDAAHNLEIARKMLKQTNQNQAQNKNQNQSESQKSGENEKGEGGDQNKGDQPEQGQTQADQQQKPQDKSQQDSGSEQAKNSERSESEKKEAEQQQGARRQQGKPQADEGGNRRQDSQSGEPSQSATSDEGEKAESKNAKSADGYPPPPDQKLQDSDQGEQQERADSGEPSPQQGHQDEAQAQDSNEEKQTSQAERQERKGEQEQPADLSREKKAEEKQTQQNSGSPDNEKNQKPSKMPTQEQNAPSGQPADTRPRLGEGMTDETGQRQSVRAPQDVDADRWLDRIQSDTEMFLKNKFFVESEMQGAHEGDKPW